MYTYYNNIIQLLNSAQFLDYFSQKIINKRSKWLGFLRQKDLSRICQNDKNRSKKLADGFINGLIALRHQIVKDINSMDHNDKNLCLLTWLETRPEYTRDALRVITEEHEYFSKTKYISPPITDMLTKTSDMDCYNNVTSTILSSSQIPHISAQYQCIFPNSDTNVRFANDSTICMDTLLVCL